MPLKRNYRLFLSLIIILPLMALTLHAYQLIIFSLTPLVPADQEIYYELKPGSSLTQMATDLQRMGLLDTPRQLVHLARWKGVLTSLKAGEYSFKGGTTPLELLRKMVKGEVIIRKVTVPEGWTFAQMMALLNANPYLNHTVQNLSPHELMRLLGFTEQYPEGLFYPDTYRFVKGTHDTAILKKAYYKMQRVLANEWFAKEGNLPYETPYQALIAASLIEKETALATERPLIAGVLINRLHLKMPLQFDPTVIYALGPAYTGKLSHANMQTKSPFNTYTTRGLPPTPIALPGAWSIHAALHPVREHYLYFVARGDGSHVFSASLQEHNQAIKSYLINKPSK